MKKRLFGMMCAAVIAVSSVPLTAYADEETENYLLKTGKTSDGTYDYEVYNDLNQGEISFDGAEVDGGAFSCKWDKTHNSMFSKGHNIETPETVYTALGDITCDYALDYTADGVGRYAAHGWIKDLRPGYQMYPLVEFLIIDGYSEWRPCSDQESLGQITDHGKTYDIYAVYHSQPTAQLAPTFPAQYLSVVSEDDNQIETGKTASVSGQIDLTKHFDAWKDAGMYMDGAVQNVEFLVEGWECSGEANVTKNIIAFGGEQTPEVTTAHETVTTAVTTTTTTGYDEHRQGKTPDGSYDYEVWNEMKRGEITFDGAETDGGAFSCTWDKTRSTFFTKGHVIDRPEVKYPDLGQTECSYEIDFSTDGIAYYGVHGWMMGMMPESTSRRRVEYYIVDGYNKWTPSAQPLGQVEDHGCTYTIYCICKTWSEWTQPEEYLYQYWSVITSEDNHVGKDGTASASHTIDIAKHFKAWDEAGLDMNCNISDVSFFVESWESSGKAKVTQTISGDSDLIPTIAAPSDKTVIRGDINNDGTCSIADAVLMQKWLLAEPGTALNNWKNADLNGDGKLDGKDFTLLKQCLLTAK